MPNHKRDDTVQVRVSAKRFKFLADLAASHGVSKRDALDALIDEFCGVCERGKQRSTHYADRVFERWVHRHGLKQRMSNANKTGQRRLIKAGKAGDEEKTAPPVPDYFRRPPPLEGRGPDA